MNRSFFTALLIATALLLPVACLTGCEREHAAQPNLVLITLDTTRADHLGCYGYSRARTSRLDAVADESVVFTRAITVSNNTLPAHAAILTGCYPPTIGVPRNSFPLPDDVPTLATMLRAAGYRTAAFISASALHSSLGLAAGFEVYDETLLVSELDQQQRRARSTTEAALAWLRNNGLSVEANQASGKKASAKSATTNSETLKRQAPAEPFFLWVHYFDPHYPYTPPHPYDKLYGTDYSGPADGSLEYIFRLWGQDTEKIEAAPADLQRMVDLYDGEIAYLDKHLRPLFDVLDAPGLKQRTLLAVVGDHGESLTEHDYLFDHGEFLYEPSVHVPLLLRLPESHVPPGGMPKTVDATVGNLDICPTFLDAAGLEIPDQVEGRSLLPLVTGRAEPDTLYYFAESCRPWSVEEQYPDEYRNRHKAQAVIDYPWKLIVTPYLNSTELYRLDSDPGELANLADEQPQRVRELLEQLWAWHDRELGPVLEPDAQNLERLRSLGYVH